MHFARRTLPLTHPPARLQPVFEFVFGYRSRDVFGRKALAHIEALDALKCEIEQQFQETSEHAALSESLSVAHKRCLDGGILLLLPISGLHEGCRLSVNRSAGGDRCIGDVVCWLGLARTGVIASLRHSIE